jgi:hypothetical protein
MPTDGLASVAALLAVPPDPADRLVVTLTGATRAGEGAAGQGAAGQRVQPLKVSIIAVTSPSG